MDHKQGADRNQLFMFCLESSISPDAFVRLVDAFTDAIDLKSFGLLHVECQEEGRPPLTLPHSGPGSRKAHPGTQEVFLPVFSWNFRLVLSFYKQFCVKWQFHFSRPDVKINARRSLKIHSGELSLI